METVLKQLKEDVEAHVQAKLKSKLKVNLLKDIWTEMKTDSMVKCEFLDIEGEWAIYGF